MLRHPAVAGRFYPSQPDALTESLKGFVEPLTPHSAIAIVVPHAGYMYSGHVAGAVYSRVRLPDRVILLGPNHTGYGPPLSIMRTGAWQTPLGRMTIDEDLSNELMSAHPGFEDDFLAHRFEHALEVQLPFIQFSHGTGVRFVPIVVGTGDWNELESLGIAIAEVLNRHDHEVLIVASTDFNHYESDSITRIKDRKAIAQIEARNASGLYETVRREQISMCGFGPTTVMLEAANRLEATTAELVKYATSADTSGDTERVVGYAGMILR